MLYGVVLHRGEGDVEFLAVDALSDAVARAIVKEAYAVDPDEIVPLEDLLAAQYAGLARLCTV